jgi:8-oxo-dGTP pyrophosphatase MutT (NUDIX family)
MVSKVIIFDKGKVLLLKRSDSLVTKESPWTWDLPGGHIDDGEHPVEAARREVKEEVDLELRDIHYIGKDKNAGKLTHFYSAGTWDGEIELSNEHKDHRWVGRRQILLYREELGEMYLKMILKLYTMS